jgi:hypothetical protein
MPTGGALRRGRRHELGVVGTEPLGHHAGVRPLVVRRGSPEADRERPDPPAGRLRHQGDDGRGVEPAGEESPERDVGDEPPLHCTAQERSEVLLGLPLVDDRPVPEAHPPVGRGPFEAPLGGDQQMRRGERENAPVERPGRRHVAVGQVEWQCRLVPPVWHGRVRQEALHLRGEGEEARAVVVEERLLPRPVAREEEAPPPRVPQREREHPVEGRDSLVPALLVEVQDDLAVAPASEAMAALELLAQLTEVVDLAVEDEPERAVLVRHRLPRGFAQVDDREAAVAEGDRGFDVEPLGIGPAVGHRARHGRHRIRRCLDVAPEEPTDPAHP